MDDCDAAAWWPDRAGDSLTVGSLRLGGDAGGDDVIVFWYEGAAAPKLDGPPELDADATIADASPAVLRLGDARAVLVVELRRLRCRLQSRRC
jgi:hypothetical protein